MHSRQTTRHSQAATWTISPHTGSQAKLLIPLLFCLLSLKWACTHGQLQGTLKQPLQTKNLVYTLTAKLIFFSDMNLFTAANKAQPHLQTIQREDATKGRGDSCGFSHAPSYPQKLKWWKTVCYGISPQWSTTQLSVFGHFQQLLKKICVFLNKSLKFHRGFTWYVLLSAVE